MRTETGRRGYDLRSCAESGLKEIIQWEPIIINRHDYVNRTWVIILFPSNISHEKNTENWESLSLFSLLSLTFFFPLYFSLPPPTTKTHYSSSSPSSRMLMHVFFGAVTKRREVALGDSLTVGRTGCVIKTKGFFGFWKMIWARIGSTLMEELEKHHCRVRNS